jgi:hypothetical protein
MITGGSSLSYQVQEGKPAIVSPFPDRAYMDICVALYAAIILTQLIRQYLHYWVLALPFYAILCARTFRNSDSTSDASF